LLKLQADDMLRLIYRIEFRYDRCHNNLPMLPSLAVYESHPWLAGGP